MVVGGEKRWKSKTDRIWCPESDALSGEESKEGLERNPPWEFLSRHQEKFFIPTSPHLCSIDPRAEQGCKFFALESKGTSERKGGGGRETSSHASSLFEPSRADETLLARRLPSSSSISSSAAEQRRRDSRLKRRGEKREGRKDVVEWGKEGEEEKLRDQEAGQVPLPPRKHRKSKGQKGIEPASRINLPEEERDFRGTSPLLSGEA